MNKKLISALVAGLALSAAAIAPAHALSISAGNFKFSLDNYDAGTTGYATFGVNYGNGVNLCSSTLGCDTAKGTSAPGSIGSEDSWGIFSITAISNLATGQNTYVSGQGGQFLTGVFYGLTDYRVDAATVFGTTYEQAFAQGGRFDLWLNNAAYDPTNSATAATNDGPAGRIGVDGYQGITNAGGTKVLSADFAAGVDPTQTAATYKNLSAPFSNYAGSGQGFLDITYAANAGGFDFSRLDTSAQVDTQGNLHDMFLDTSYSDANGIASSLGWSVHSVTQVTGNAIPEPGSMALVGLGLMGLAGLRRRKEQA